MATVPIDTLFRGAMMTNAQTRLLAVAMALLAVALAPSTDNLNVNAGIVMILASGAIFLAEYVHSLR